MSDDRTHFLAALMKKGAEDASSLTVRETGDVLATRIEVAFDSESRKRGLLGRASLAPGHALIIAPCSGIHTFGMQFPIDVVFVGRSGKVLKVRRNMPAGRIAASLRAFTTIELAAGGAPAALAPGQHVEVRGKTTSGIVSAENDSVG